MLNNWGALLIIYASVVAVSDQSVTYSVHWPRIRHSFPEGTHFVVVTIGQMDQVVIIKEIYRHCQNLALIAFHDSFTACDL